MTCNCKAQWAGSEMDYCFHVGVLWFSFYTKTESVTLQLLNGKPRSAKSPCSCESATHFKYELCDVNADTGKTYREVHQLQQIIVPARVVPDPWLVAIGQKFNCAVLSSVKLSTFTRAKRCSGSDKKRRLRQIEIIRKHSIMTSKRLLASQRPSGEVSLLSFAQL